MHKAHDDLLKKNCIGSSQVNQTEEAFLAQKVDDHE
jgi:hypothetical protein